MSASAVALVLVSSFLHALWNARTHSGPDRLGTLLVSYVVGATWLSPWIVIDPPLEVWGLILLSGCLHAAYITALAAAYDRGALAVTYPIARGSAPLVVAGVGIWFLDQVPTAITVAGAVMVALGLLLIGHVGWGTGERSGLVLALTTGVVIGGYTLVDARAVEDVNGWSFFATSSYLGAFIAVVVNRVRWRRLRRSLRSGLAVGLVSSTAYALVLLAYSRADAANVATLRSTSILFGLALVPRTLTRPLVVGAVITVAGVAMVAI
ncbi:MAG: EamA family transporter [Actinomycetota bacterium]